MKLTTCNALFKWAVCTLALFAHSSFAGCFDNVTHVTAVNSKIKGFYVNEAGTVHYVILDRDNCTVTSTGTLELAPVTKNHYYLSIDDNNTFMLSTLLAAYAQDQEVHFRLFHGNENYNKLIYAVAPSSAAP